MVTSVEQCYTTEEPTIDHTRGEHANPCFTTLKVNTLTITPLMNPRSTTLKVNMLTITHVHLECGRSWVSMFTLSVVDHGFISGVMVSMFTLSVVDRGFISGVMVSMFTMSVVDCGLA
jgi:hypothetical protein